LFNVYIWNHKYPTYKDSQIASLYNVDRKGIVLFVRLCVNVFAIR
jgi:hypothetical protein